MTRHRWTKLRTHVYVCRVCGTGRVNAWSEVFDAWVVTWHKSDGTTQVKGRTPPCAVGVRTKAVLAKHGPAILAAVLAGERPATRPASRARCGFARASEPPPE